MQPTHHAASFPPSATCAGPIPVVHSVCQTLASDPRATDHLDREALDPGLRQVLPVH